MAKEFKLEDPGEGIHEAEIREIHVAEGDEIEDGDTVLTIETDKAATEVPAPFSGTIEEIRVKEGDLVRVGDVLMTYSEEGETDKEPEEEKEEKEEEPEKKTEKREKPEKPKQREKGPVPASPATRRVARELGVDLYEVEPGGPEGRVTTEDVRAFAGEEEKPPEKKKPEEKSEEEVAEKKPAKVAREVPELPDFSQWGPVERTPLRSVRRATAERMALAWSQIPHVMHQDVADITELERFRRAHRETVEAEGGQLTTTVLVMKAAVAALKAFPRFNASLDMESGEIILKQYYHLGVAVDTGQGLLVPVVRDVDRKSIAELAVDLTELADKARAGELGSEDMQGGTFTVTNPGPIGGTAFTPIINYPEVAILGMARAELAPVAQGDLDEYELSARLRLPLCLAFDHRVIDGAEAARFVRAIIDRLSDPESFLLTV